MNLGPKPSGIQFTGINRQVLTFINKNQQIFNTCAQKYLSFNLQMDKQAVSHRKMRSSEDCEVAGSAKCKQSGKTV